MANIFFEAKIPQQSISKAFNGSTQLTSDVANADIVSLFPPPKHHVMQPWQG